MIKRMIGAGVLGFAAILLAACGGGGAGGGGNENSSNHGDQKEMPVTPPLAPEVLKCHAGSVTFEIADEKQWEAAFKTIVEEVKENGGYCQYVLDIGESYLKPIANHSSYFPSNEYDSRKNPFLSGDAEIVLRGSGTIEFEHDGMFRLEHGTKLVIDGPTIKSWASYNIGYPVIIINGQSSITLERGAIIGTSVVASGGSNYGTGGAVRVTLGTFTMNGGTITGSFTQKGGAVYVATPGAFIMNGGTIIGGNAEEGGGVYVERLGTFTMTGGTISGGSATLSGGGVHLDYLAKFTKTGNSVIYGDDESSINVTNKNTAANGQGHAVFYNTMVPKLRNVTLGVGDTMDTTGNALVGFDY